jgi:hypothetical protein
MNLPLKHVIVHTMMKKMLPITPLGEKFADMINPHMIIGIINKVYHLYKGHTAVMRVSKNIKEISVR